MTTFMHSFCSRHFFCVDHESYPTVADLKQAVFHAECKPYDSCFFICNGKLVDDDEPVKPNSVYHTYLRLPGGKGGFGSMLRAIGAQIEKTTNHEACRDLSGRRMRDVNNEKDLKDWLAKQAEREREKEQRRQDRLARRRAMPNHKFDDPTYDQQRSLLSENQEDALLKGLQKTKAMPSTSATVTSEEISGCKRKCDSASTSTKAKKKKDTEWFGIDMEDISDLDSDEESENNDAGTCAQPGPSTDTDNSSSNGEPDRIDLSHPDVSPDTANSDNVPGTSNNSSTTQSACQDVGESSNSEKVNAERFEPVTSPSCTNVSQAENQQEISKSSSADGETNTSEDTGETKQTDPCTTQEDKPLVLDEVTCVKELEAFGLERLKSELMSRSLKCGGTLEQRAERLFSVKGLAPDQIDPALFSKSNGKKVKNRK